MFDFATRGSNIFLQVILLFSLLQLGAFIALTLEWNADQLSPCVALTGTISAGTAICGSLCGFYSMLTLVLFALVVFHHFCRRISSRTLKLTSLATSIASVIMAGASFVSLEVVVRSYGIMNPCLSTVPYAHSIVILLISFVINVSVFRFVDGMDDTKKPHSRSLASIINIHYEHNWMW